MENKIEESIIKTLAYFDIFDYPLTIAEIKKYCPKTLKMSNEEFHGTILGIPIIQEANSFFYFLGRSEIISKRTERNDISIQKFGKARVVANILSKIPTIEYIGVSGSLSMNNSTSSDDIDLFFITTKKTMWITRFMVNVALILLRQKRAKHTTNARDKICPNMFVDSGRLKLPKNRANLYTAHEIIQLRTLYEKNNMHAFFMNANKWAQNYLPNIEIPVFKERAKNKFSRIFHLFASFEKLFFLSQKMYMRKTAKNETVLPKLAMFHPVNKEKVILDLYDIKAEKYLSLYNDNKWIESDEARFYLDEKKIRILN